MVFRIVGPKSACPTLHHLLIVSTKSGIPAVKLWQGKVGKSCGKKGIGSAKAGLGAKRNGPIQWTRRSLNNSHKYPRRQSTGISELTLHRLFSVNKLTPSSSPTFNQHHQNFNPSPSYPIIKTMRSLPVIRRLASSEVESAPPNIENAMAEAYGLFTRESASCWSFRGGISAKIARNSQPQMHFP